MAVLAERWGKDSGFAAKVIIRQLIKSAFIIGRPNAYQIYTPSPFGGLNSKTLNHDNQNEKNA